MNIIDSVELTRMTFLIGIVIALIFRRKFGFNAGGIVVPAFLAILLSKSVLLFGLMFLLSFVVFFLYEVTFGKKALRGRYPVLIKTIYSVLLVGLLAVVLKKFSHTEAALVGYVVPGLMSASYRRHHVRGVATGTFFVSILTYAIGVLLGNILPVEMLTHIQTKASELDLATTTISNKPIQFGVSILVTVFAYVKSRARVGGLIILPIIAALFFSPVNFVLFLAITAVVYKVVQFVQKYAHLIGLDRFVFATVLAISFVWLVEVLLLNAGVSFAPLLLTTLFVPIAVGVWVNDLSVQGFKRSVKPFSLATIVAILVNIVF